MAKRGGRAAKAVGHQVAEAEQNFIWKALNGVFRPVKTDAFTDLEKAAGKRGRKLADPRAGHPTHRSHNRLTREQQGDVAADLGYSPYFSRGTQPKAPLFHKPGGEPPYISHDLDGHGSIDRSGQNLPGNVAWKGADNPAQLNVAGRDGTYVPKYDEAGNIIFDRVRD